MLSPARSAPFGRGTDLIWDHGDAEGAMCCALKQQGAPPKWCTETQLECTTPELSSVSLYVLSEPFSDESRVPDDATYCFVGVHHDTIIAIWHRYWS